MIFCYDSYRNPHWLYKNICSKDPQLTLHHDQYDINNNILYTCLSVSLPINKCFNCKRVGQFKFEVPLCNY